VTGASRVSSLRDRSNIRPRAATTRSIRSAGGATLGARAGCVQERETGMASKKAPRTAKPAREAKRAIGTQRRGGGTAGAAPRVPADWDEDTSLRHWFPDEKVRAELTARAKAAARAKGPAQTKKSWAAVAALFPRALGRLIGDCPWRFGAVPSPEVAEMAMRLLEQAAKAKTTVEVEEISNLLNRILPELPALCLPEVVGDEAYSRALDRLGAGGRGDEEVAFARVSLRDYLSST